MSTFEIILKIPKNSSLIFVIILFIITRYYYKIRKNFLLLFNHAI